MSDSKKNEVLKEGYIPTLTTVVSDTDSSKFGYQPTKSSGNSPSNTPQQTSSPPKKP